MIAVTILASRCGYAVADDTAGRLDSAVIDFFETRVRPVFAENCHACHGPEKQKNELRLDSLEGLLHGGATGPVLVPGKPEESRLIQAVRYGGDLKMPPRGKLSERQIEDLGRWVKMGAPWPGGRQAAGSAPGKATIDRAKGRDHWSFRPVGPVEPPSPSRWSANPIDAFILAKLQARGIQPNAIASPRELVRRVYFDLIGLPPPAEAIDRFAADPTEAAWAQLIDDLLARPQYGERWGRHWLDVVRYADSNGYERDDEKPYSWRYRDYVIDALNDDKPYDRFVLEQLAGDELPDASAETIAATGFYRLGVWDDEPDDARMAEFDYLDDVLRTAGSAFLGLTVGCARCHDHKFDPIAQQDYYALLAFIRSVSPHAKPSYDLAAAAYAPLAPPAVVAKWKREAEARHRSLEVQIAACAEQSEKARLEELLKKEKAAAPPFEWTLAVREHRTAPVSTQVLIRGSAGSPGAEVEPAFIGVLAAEKPRSPVPLPENGSTGRRRVLAEWLAAPSHPLTARVMVNRVWQHHFGRGIVETSGDFGTVGAPPTHPELLDWLAGQFVSRGWSVKALHRLILTSSAYRLSSAQSNERARALDQGNQLWWRQSLRRLDAEAIRDCALSVSGLLSTKMGGRGMFPRLDKEVIAGGSRPGLGWEHSSAAERRRRSVYVFVKRTMQDPLLEGFDYTNTAQPLELRPTTTVAPQALLLLNSRFTDEQASALADRLEREAGPSSTARVEHAYRLALGRSPAPGELAIALELLADQERAFAALAPSISFVTLAPAAISAAFLGLHQETDILGGPRHGWSYLRGRWGNGYEGIDFVDPVRGPAALWDGEAPADVTVECRVRLRPASESFGLILRARPHGGVFTGYEVGLDPRSGRMAIRRHREDGVETLAEKPAPIQIEREHTLQVEATGRRVAVWLDSESVPWLDVEDSAPLAPAGKVGVKTWGSTADVLRLTMRSDGTVKDILAASLDPRATPGRQALESFARVLLNLNELVYID